MQTAQVFYRYAFNIDSSPSLLGLVNSAPYLCLALSCLYVDLVSYKLEALLLTYVFR